MTSTELTPMDFMNDKLPEVFQDRGDVSRLLNVVEQQETFQAREWLYIDETAPIVGMTPSSFRSIVFNPESDIQRKVDPDTRRVQVDKSTVLNWLERTDRARWLKLTNPEADSRSAKPATVIKEALSNWGCSYHSKCKPDAKAMAAVVTPNDITIAIEKRGRAKLWMRPLTTAALPGIESGRSEGSTINLKPNENYGRHSGLKKYPELKEATLVWYAPETMEDFGRLMAAITESDEVSA